MGIPASSYHLFKSITHPENDRWLTIQAKEILKSFSLFAFIIYDPEKDPDFSNYLNKKFGLFDHITGENFLFFCLIKGERQRDKFLLFSTKENWQSDKPAEAVNDISFSAQALCTYLGISYESTPCLCVTTDFSFDTFYLIRTETTLLEHQLSQLTETANFFKENIVRNNIYLGKVLATLDSRYRGKFDHSEFHLQESSLVQKLDVFLSAIKSKGNTYINTEAKSDLTNWYNRELQNLKGISDENKWLELASITSLSMDIGKGYITGHNEPCLLHEPEAHYPPAIIDWKESFINIVGLEITTKNFLKSAVGYEKFLQSNHRFSDINEYSGYAIAICKAFENEINLSIVQWIRQYLGIEMPRFFNLLKPGGNEYQYLISTSIIPNPRPIMYNKESRGRWLPPGIGESALSFKSILTTDGSKAFNHLDGDYQNLLLDHWAKINRIRQKVAHAEPVIRVEKEALDQNVERLYTTGLLKTLVTLKERLGR